jgi:hypothetical protein
MVDFVKKSETMKNFLLNGYEKERALSAPSGKRYQ